MKLSLCSLLLLLTGALRLSAVQYCEVQVYPANYSFATAEIQRDNETCNIFNISYTVCVGPGRLTDSELGPQGNTTFDSSYYYTWQGRSSDRLYTLFTFNQTESISNITLHYYVHNQEDSQPRVNVFGVEDGFKIQSPNLTGRVHHTIEPQPTSIGTHSASIVRSPNQPPVNISTTRIVLQIRGPVNMFSLSEIKFFANISSSTPCPNPPTGPSATEEALTNYSPTQLSSTEPPATTTTTSMASSSTIPTNSTATTTGKPSLTVAAPVHTGSESTVTTSTEPPSASVPTAAIAAGAAVALLLLIALAVTITIIILLKRSKRRGKTEPTELVGYTGQGEELKNTLYASVPTRNPLTGETTTNESFSGVGVYAVVGPREYASIDEIAHKKKSAPKEEEEVKQLTTGEDKSAPPVTVEGGSGTEKEEELKTGIFDNPEQYYAVVDKSKTRSKNELNTLADDNDKEEEEEEEGKSLQAVYAVVQKPKKSGEGGVGGEGGEDRYDKLKPPKHTEEAPCTVVDKK